MTETLLKLGLDPSHRGFDYVRKALEILQKTPHIKMTTLYEELAKHFDSTWKRVERCIRHVIEASITKGSYALQCTIYGNVWSSSKQSLTNSQFLHCLRIYLEAHK